MTFDFKRVKSQHISRIPPKKKINGKDKVRKSSLYTALTQKRGALRD